VEQWLEKGVYELGFIQSGEEIEVSVFRRVREFAKSDH
jgi:hypothetical protein